MDPSSERLSDPYHLRLVDSGDNIVLAPQEQAEDLAVNQTGLVQVEDIKSTLNSEADTSQEGDSTKPPENSSYYENLPGQDTTDEQKLSFSRRIGNIALAAKSDIENSEHKLGTAVTGIGVIALQGLSRLQASWVFVPEVAVNVFKDTKSPTAAALAGGLAFGSWCLATGGITAEGLSKYPRALKEFNKNFPKFVDFFKDTLPGFEEVDHDDNSQFARAKYIGKNILDHVKRGLTVMGVGSAVYAGTASAKGRDRKDVHKLNLKASLDGGLGTGLLVFSLAETIERIAQSNPTLANHIQNTASDVKVWYGVAGFFMLEQYIENKIKKHKEKHKTTVS